jgi:excinuclease UvrABC ATPase subunit
VKTIEVVGARENNLRGIDVRIPKGRLTVVTGVSGSGKSSLAFGTIAAEAQRQFGETVPAFVRHRLDRYGRPDVDALRGLTAAIVVDQRRIGGNARSTVGTATDVAPLLRLLYSRLSVPHVGLSAAFSFNDPAGMCPRCAGLGTVVDVDVDVWSGLFDPDKPLRDYTPGEWDTLLHARDLVPPDPTPDWPRTATLQGVLPWFRHGYLEGGVSRVPAGVREEVDRLVTRRTCPECEGDRLAADARKATVGGRTIGECARMEVGELAAFLRTLDDPVAAPLVAAMLDRLDALVEVGLGHLALGRETPTLSGGEAQRVTLVRHLGSSLTDLTYVLDEPSAGLHPHDVDRLLTLLRGLRDRGNTVLVVEHDLDVLAAADHVVDLGPGAGADGGRVVYTGGVAGLRRADTPTGALLRRPLRLREPRPPAGTRRISGPDVHNLRDVDVELPLGVLTAVTGVAGSGKSSFAAHLLPAVAPEAVLVDQSPLRGSKRSTPASYLGMLDPVRRAFARANGVPAALFSANSTGGCPVCRGLGAVETDLAFLPPVSTACEACRGTGFTAEALSHTLHGRTIADVLALDVDRARAALADVPGVAAVLDRLVDVGLGHLGLGRPVSSLSGGERQRLRLAAHPDVDGALLVLDEPTAGLHGADVARLLALFDRLVARGATLVVVEHDLDVVAAADHVIELGPGAGRGGGRVVFTGTPAELAAADTVTGRHLARRLRDPVRSTRA